MTLRRDSENPVKYILVVKDLDGSEYISDRAFSSAVDGTSVGLDLQDIILPRFLEDHEILSLELLKWLLYSIPPIILNVRQHSYYTGISLPYWYSHVVGIKTLYSGQPMAAREKLIGEFSKRWSGVDWNQQFDDGLRANKWLDGMLKLEELTKGLPGTDQIVEIDGSQQTLRDWIITWNDANRLTRPEIADRLDELADAGKINIDWETC